MNSSAVQLGLSLVHRWDYAPAHYLVHAGADALLASLAGQLTQPGFRALWLVAPKKSGKTHLAVKLFELLRAHEIEAAYLVGREFLTHEFRESTAKQAIVVDEMHEYLAGVAPGSSGPFVRAYEEARLKGVSILFLSAKEITELPCDEHVKSRINSGDGLHIGPPDESELPELVRLMARQRALRIDDRHIKYLVQRAGRDVSKLSVALDRLMGSGRVNSFRAISDALR